MIDFAIRPNATIGMTSKFAIWMNRQIDPVDVAIDIAHNVAAVTVLGRDVGVAGGVSLIRPATGYGTTTTIAFAFPL
jgi:hypothetical protein